MGRNSKIIISAILIIALIWIWAVPFGAIEIKRYYGDINNDSYVTAKDVILALEAATDIIDQPLEGMDLDAADLNGDGTVDVNEARQILRMSSGLQAKRFMEGYEFDENAYEFLSFVNEYRKSANKNAQDLKISEELCNVARIAAEEYATQTGSALTRADGSFYKTLLKENGVKGTLFDKVIIVSSFGHKQTFDSLLKDTQGRKAICSSNFKKFGIGAYSPNGHTFYWCILLSN